MSLSRNRRIDQERQEKQDGISIDSDGAIVCGKIRILRDFNRDGWVFPGGRFERSMNKATELARRLNYEVYGMQGISKPQRELYHGLKFGGDNE